MAILDMKDEKKREKTKQLKTDLALKNNSVDIITRKRVNEQRAYVKQFTVVDEDKLSYKYQG